MSIPAYAISFPAEGLNPYYTPLANFINTTINTINGGLWVGLNASFYNLNITNYLSVIGNVNITGTLNATTIYQNGNQVQTVESVFNFANNLTYLLDNNTIIRTANSTWFTTLYDLRTDRFGIANYSSEYSSTGYKKANITINYPDMDLNVLDDFTKLNLTTILSGGVANILVDTVQVNKQLLIIGNISNVNVTNVNVNGSILPALDANFDIGNSTLRWRNANFSGTVGIGTLSLITSVDLVDF